MEINNKQIEALRELINIGVGKGASILNTMLSSHIILQVPKLKLLSSSELIEELKRGGEEKLSHVSLKFDGPFSGSAELMFPTETALVLVNTLVGDSPAGMDFDSIKAGTLCEVGNVVLNGVMGSISNFFSSYFTYSVPEFLEDTPENIFSEKVLDDNLTIILAKTRFIIQELDIDGDIILFFEVGALTQMMEMTGII
jgi:chemotaxis protein CheC